MTFLNGLSTLPFQNYLSPYLREELGFDVAFASSVWALNGMIGMVSGFIVGAISDRTGVRAALMLSYGCVLAAAVLLAASPVGRAPLISAALFALAFYPIFGLIPAYVAKVADGSRATRIFAISNVTVGLGGVAGNYLAGALKSATGSFAGVYVAIAATSAVLVLLSALLPGERSGCAIPDPAVAK
jgi:predicted MFS family arabinose efflux permease